MTSITGLDETRLEVGVVDQTAAFDDLRSEWNAALEASADPNIFLSWEWLRTWWRHFGETDPRAELHVVVIRDAQGVVAAAPLFRARLGAGPLQARVLRQVSFDAGDYGGMILVRHHDEAVAALLDHVAEQIRGDVHAAVVSRVADDSVLLSRLRGCLAAPSRRSRLAARELTLDGPCPYADVRAGYDLRKHLKKHKVRQRLRRIEEKYETAFTWHSGDTLEDGLERLVDVHRRRWSGKEDELQGQLADPGREAFLLDVLRELDGVGRLRLLTLTADGRTVGAELGFELARRVYMFKGAFDPEFAEFSPGQLLTYRVFEEGIARAVDEFDFLRGDHPYKRRWSNGERHLVTVTMTRPGLVGRLATARTSAARLVDRVR